MHLFDMTDSDIDRAAESYYDRLYDIYYGTGSEICCKNCENYDGTVCTLAVDELSDEEFEAMKASRDWSKVEVDEDGYCDDYKSA